MKYKILRTDTAEEQLRRIIFYIADQSDHPGTALAYLEKIENAVIRLQDFPESGSVPKYSILKKQGYRVLIVEKHLIFYTVCKKERIVIIHAIIDGRREYLDLL